MRRTAELRVSARPIGPSWATPTTYRRAMPPSCSHADEKLFARPKRQCKVGTEEAERIFRASMTEDDEAAPGLPLESRILEVYGRLPAGERRLADVVLKLI